ncbi:putative protein [Drosophila innubila nudivirus]|uniref:Uncharacterized protein n=1 Tax=Drosophila innubila nudivirus TaxID=2057187 RepID=A0A2H4UXA7_9VIRU|nr:putative protein [Drosophila innubila nudivirus]ATZ81552.1 putative protein [Drosophila innubila nudivirus]
MDPEMEALKMRIRTLKPLEYPRKLNRQPTRLQETCTNRRYKKPQHFYSLLPPSTAVLNDAMPELSDIVNGPSSSMPQKSGKTKNKFKSALSRFFNVGGGGGGRNKRKSTNKNKKLTVDDIIVNTDSIILMKNPKDVNAQKQQQYLPAINNNTTTAPFANNNNNNGPHSQLLNIIHSDDNFKIAMDIAANNEINKNNNNAIEENIYQNTMQRKIAALNFINASAPSSSSLVTEMYDFPPLPPLPTATDITSSGRDDDDNDNDNTDNTTNNVDYDEVANLIYDAPLDDSGHISNGITANATDAISVNNTTGYDYDDGDIYEEILTPNRGSFNYSDSTFDSVTDDDDDDNNTDDVEPIESVTTIANNKATTTTDDNDVIATVTVE